MFHPPDHIARTFPEPADGTHVAVQGHDGYWYVIWREDHNGHDTDRWFLSHDTKPTDLYEHLKDAIAAQVIDKPTNFYD